MKLFVKGDLDGFFGLFVDNLVQLLMIILFCSNLCGMSDELLYGVVLPGCAISIVLGNLFYAWQAHRLAKKEKRSDVTALPYGINTPSVIVFVFFIIKPTFDATGDPLAAWRMGVLACLGSGLIEFVGAFAGGFIRKQTPRAALLSTLAGIAIGFISMSFTLQIFHKPMIALVPLALVLVGLFSRFCFPGNLPGGLIAVLVGTALAWLLALAQQYVPNIPQWLTFGSINFEAVQKSTEGIGLRLPVWCLEDIKIGLNDVKDWLPFLSVVIPMGLFNVVGSLQNIESAEASGDKYQTGTSMAANGIGTIVAGLFGSCFPTTIYIGHPGWKGLGARAGYSTLNGIAVVAICLFGLVGTIANAVPIEVGAGIVLWIGMIITAQAFTASKSEHAPAVAIGLFPAIAAWGATVMLGTLMSAKGVSLLEFVTPDQGLDHTTQEVNGFLVHGLLLMERGYIFTCMILAATCANLIDRKFLSASIWMFTASVLTASGAMHAYQVYSGFVFDYLFRFMQAEENSYAYRANDIAVGYVLCGLVFLIIHFYARNQKPTDGH